MSVAQVSESAMTTALAEAPVEAPPLTVEQAFLRVRHRLETVLAHFRIPPQDAEDLVQDAVIGLLRKRDQVRDPELWLLGAVRKECLMYWRTHRRRLEQALDDVAFFLEDEPAQERRMLTDDLNRAIQTLRPRCQSLLKLRYRLGFATHEVAASLGCTLSSIDNITRRCLATLSQRMLRGIVPAKGGS